MTPETFFNIIEMLTSVALLVWFFAHPWQKLWIDVSRQRYFELENRLFLLALKGDISFNDPAYLTLQESLNHRSKFAHDNVFGDLVALLIAFRGTVPKNRTIQDHIGKVENADLKAELYSIFDRANQIQIIHMGVRSPLILLLTVLTPFILVVELLSGGVRTLIRRLSDLTITANHNVDQKEILDNS